MKKNRILITSLLLLAFAFITHEVRSHVNGAQAGLSGGAGENNCTQCHSGTLNSGVGNVTITSNAPADQYVPGNTYTITVSMEQTGINRFGFEVLSAYSSFQAKSMGTVIITNTTETQQKALGNKRYVTHKLAGTPGTNTKTWTFDWTAPDPGFGALTFFMAGNATDNNAKTTGDQVYTRTLVLSEIPVSVFEPELTETSAIVFPSATQDVWNLKIENAGLNPVAINVFDSNGQQVFTEIINPVGNTIQRAYTADSWATGIYFVQVIINGKSEMMRLLKI